jgi:WD40-like Beta Propeller Repeat
MKIIKTTAVMTLLLCITFGTGHAQTAGAKTLVLPPAIIDPSVQVALEKSIQMPSIEGRNTPARLTRIAWSEVTNQIAASAFVSAQQYVVDPDSGKTVIFETGISGVADTLLQWSRKQPMLVASKGVVTKVYDTRESPAKPPQLLREIKTAVPRPLVIAGVSITQAGPDEWVVLGGGTNRDLDPSNPEVAAFSLTTGQRVLEWQFPTDGISYHPRENAAAMSAQSLILAGWVQLAVLATETRPEINAHTMWIVDLATGKKRCELDIFQGVKKYGSPGMDAPILSPSGQWLVFSAGWSTRTYMYVYDTSNCRQVAKQLVGASPAYGDYAFSPNGKWLVSTQPMFYGDYEQGRLSMWRTSDWKLVYDAPASAHYRAAFNKTSDRFAVGLIGNMHIYRVTER